VSLLVSRRQSLAQLLREKQRGAPGRRLSVRLPEPQRRKSHWDFVLDEALWVASDVFSERRWKISVLKVLSLEAALAGRRRLLGLAGACRPKVRRNEAEEAEQESRKANSRRASRAVQRAWRAVRRLSRSPKVGGTRVLLSSGSGCEGSWLSSRATWTLLRLMRGAGWHLGWPMAVAGAADGAEALNDDGLRALSAERLLGSAGAASPLVPRSLWAERARFRAAEADEAADSATFAGPQEAMSGLSGEREPLVVELRRRIDWFQGVAATVSDMVFGANQHPHLPPTASALSRSLDHSRSYRLRSEDPPGAESQLSRWLSVRFLSEVEAGVPLPARRRLRPYQLSALRWLHGLSHGESAGGRSMGGILADDRGLGKRCVCVSHAAMIAHRTLCRCIDDDEGAVLGDTGSGTLVVCPPELLWRWASEVQRWWPAARVSILGPSAAPVSPEISAGSKGPSPIDVVLASPHALRSAYQHPEHWPLPGAASLRLHLWGCVFADATMGELAPREAFLGGNPAALAVSRALGELEQTLPGVRSCREATARASELLGEVWGAALDETVPSAPFRSVDATMLPWSVVTRVPAVHRVVVANRLLSVDPAIAMHTARFVFGPCLPSSGAVSLWTGADRRPRKLRADVVARLSAGGPSSSSGAQAGSTVGSDDWLEAADAEDSQEADRLNDEDGSSLRDAVLCVCLRRQLRDPGIGAQLPPLHASFIACEPTRMQRAARENTLSSNSAVAAIASATATDGSPAALLVLLARLHAVAQHSAAVPGGGSLDAEGLALDASCGVAGVPSFSQWWRGLDAAEGSSIAAAFAGQGHVGVTSVLSVQAASPFSSCCAVYGGATGFGTDLSSTGVEGASAARSTQVFGPVSQVCLEADSVASLRVLESLPGVSALYPGFGLAGTASLASLRGYGVGSAWNAPRLGAALSKALERTREEVHQRLGACKRVERGEEGEDDWPVLLHSTHANAVAAGRCGGVSLWRDGLLHNVGLSWFCAPSPNSVARVVHEMSWQSRVDGIEELSEGVGRGRLVWDTLRSCQPAQRLSSVSRVAQWFAEQGPPNWQRREGRWGFLPRLNGQGSFNPFASRPWEPLRGLGVVRSATPGGSLSNAVIPQCWDGARYCHMAVHNGRPWVRYSQQCPVEPLSKVIGGIQGVWQVVPECVESVPLVDGVGSVPHEALRSMDARCSVSGLASCSSKLATLRQVLSEAASLGQRVLVLASTPHAANVAHAMCRASGASMLRLDGRRGLAAADSGLSGALSELEGAPGLFDPVAVTRFNTDPAVRVGVAAVLGVHESASSSRQDAGPFSFDGNDPSVHAGVGSLGASSLSGDWTQGALIPYGADVVVLFDVCLEPRAAQSLREVLARLAVSGGGGAGVRVVQMATRGTVEEGVLRAAARAVRAAAGHAAQAGQAVASGSSEWGGPGMLEDPVSGVTRGLGLSLVGLSASLLRAVDFRSLACGEMRAPASAPTAAGALAVAALGDALDSSTGRELSSLGTVSASDYSAGLAAALSPNGPVTPLRLATVLTQSVDVPALASQVAAWSTVVLGLPPSSAVAARSSKAATATRRGARAAASQRSRRAKAQAEPAPSVPLGLLPAERPEATLALAHSLGLMQRSSGSAAQACERVFTLRLPLVGALIASMARRARAREGAEADLLLGLSAETGCSLPARTKPWLSFLRRAPLLAAPTRIVDGGSELSLLYPKCAAAAGAPNRVAAAAAEALAWEQSWAGALHMSQAFGPPHPSSLTFAAPLAAVDEPAASGALRVLLSHLEHLALARQSTQVGSSGSSSVSILSVTDAARRAAVSRLRSKRSRTGEALQRADGLDQVQSSSAAESLFGALIPSIGAGRAASVAAAGGAGDTVLDLPGARKAADHARELVSTAAAWAAQANGLSGAAVEAAHAEASKVPLAMTVREAAAHAARAAIEARTDSTMSHALLALEGSNSKNRPGRRGACPVASGADVGGTVVQTRQLTWPDMSSRARAEAEATEEMSGWGLDRPAPAWLVASGPARSGGIPDTLAVGSLGRGDARSMLRARLRRRAREGEDCVSGPQAPLALVPSQPPPQRQDPASQPWHPWEDRLLERLVHSAGAHWDLVREGLRRHPESKSRALYRTNRQCYDRHRRTIASAADPFDTGSLTRWSQQSVPVAGAAYRVGGSAGEGVAPPGGWLAQSQVRNWRSTGQDAPVPGDSVRTVPLHATPAAVPEARPEWQTAGREWRVPPSEAEEGTDPNELSSWLRGPAALPASLPAQWMRYSRDMRADMELAMSDAKVVSEALMRPPEPVIASIDRHNRFKTTADSLYRRVTRALTERVAPKRQIVQANTAMPVQDVHLSQKELVPEYYATLLRGAEEAVRQGRPRPTVPPLGAPLREVVAPYEVLHEASIDATASLSRRRTKYYRDSAPYVLRFNARAQRERQQETPARGAQSLQRPSAQQPASAQPTLTSMRTAVPAVQPGHVALPAVRAPVEAVSRKRSGSAAMVTRGTSAPKRQAIGGPGDAAPTSAVPAGEESDPMARLQEALARFNEQPPEVQAEIDRILEDPAIPDERKIALIEPYFEFGSSGGDAGSGVEADPGTPSAASVSAPPRSSGRRSKSSRSRVRR
jgi:hypothetical protein